MVAMTSFAQKSAAAWRVNMKHLLALLSVQFLIYSTFVLVIYVKRAVIKRNEHRREMTG